MNRKLKIGDKIILSNEAFILLNDGKEIARIARLPYVTIMEINDLYIRFKETNYLFDLYDSSLYEIYENKLSQKEQNKLDGQSTIL